MILQNFLIRFFETPFPILWEILEWIQDFLQYVKNVINHLPFYCPINFQGILCSIISLTTKKFWNLIIFQIFLPSSIFLNLFSHFWRNFKHLQHFLYCFAKFWKNFIIFTFIISLWGCIINSSTNIFMKVIAITNF